MANKFVDELQIIREHIKKVYIELRRPFIIGFSGGKDSTMTLQLVWEALRELNPSDLKNPVHVISTDTLVETPFFISHINDSLDKINSSAIKQQLPITAHKLIPEFNNSFWVNLIGKGYPAPSQTFRWCTDRMKIKPVNKFIQENVQTSKEVVVVLGARKDESISRAQVIENKEKNASQLGLTMHPDLMGTLVYTPISELKTDKVWLYLNMTENPWGADNKILQSMYQIGSDDTECPTVVDDKTSSCGNSRFGCWVCTVVSKDTSMENVVKEDGNEWMQRLLNFRNMLKETIKVENKSKYRSHKRRNGSISLVRDGSKIAYGPYKFEYRKRFLEEILDIQYEIQTKYQKKDFKIIHEDELKEIRLIWLKEEYDWADTVQNLYSKYNQNSDIFDSFELIFDQEDLLELSKICNEKDVDFNLVARILNLEVSMNQNSSSLKSRRIKEIENIFLEDWKTEEEILEELRSNQFKIEGTN